MVLWHGRRTGGSTLGAAWSYNISHFFFFWPVSATNGVTSNTGALGAKYCATRNEGVKRGTA
jgi:hypothetical protein